MKKKKKGDCCNWVALARLPCLPKKLDLVCAAQIIYIYTATSLIKHPNGDIFYNVFCVCITEELNYAGAEDS
jgi:hypothetical protein